MTSLAATRKRTLKSGFTLMELVLVVTIMMVLIGLSAPRFEKTFAGLRLKDAAFCLCALVDYAQQEAVIERKDFKISFDFLQGQYRLCEMDESANPPAYQNVAGKIGRLFSLPRGSSLKGSENEMVFYPDGHSENARIDVLGHNGLGYAIVVSGLGTHVEVQEAAHG